MRALFTALVASIEAAAVALFGMLIVGVPAILLWLVTFDLAAEPTQVLGATLAIWFLAHLVPLDITIDSEIAAGMGLPQDDISFPLSLAPLGLTLITAVFATRSGWRFGVRGGAGAGAVIGGVVGFGVMALLAAPLTGDTLQMPLWRAAAVPAAIYGACVAAGFIVRAATDAHPWLLRIQVVIQRGIQKLKMPGAADFPRRAATVARLTTASVAAVIALAAVAFTVSLVAGYVQVAAVSQSLQLDVLGAAVLFLLQLMLLPVALVWAASWLSGAGFSVGTGSSVTPFETLLGPLPSLPIFGAIPNAWGGFGALAPALVVLAAFVVGVVFARKQPLRGAHWSVALIVPMLAAAFAGLVFSGLGALANGAIGPARMAEAGTPVWEFGGLIAAELAVGLLLGVFAGRLDTGRLQAAVADLIPRDAADTIERDPDPDPVRVPVALRRSVPGGSLVALPQLGDEQETVPIIERDGIVVDNDGAIPEEDDGVFPDWALGNRPGWGENLEPVHDDAGETADYSETAEPFDVEEAEDPAWPADPEDQDADEDEDELLKAFSWEGFDGTVDQPLDPSRDDAAAGDDDAPHGWRFPRRKR